MVSSTHCCVQQLAYNHHYARISLIQILGLEPDHDDLDLDNDDDINPTDICVMVMSYCHRCDVIVTHDGGDEHDGDLERVRRCD